MYTAIAWLTGAVLLWFCAEDYGCFLKAPMCFTKYSDGSLVSLVSLVF